MTNEELQAMKARAEAATPGPWHVEQKDCRVLRAPNAPASDSSLMGDEQYYPWTPDRDEDWQFIAHARTDVPKLVAEIEDLRWVLSVIGEHGEGAFAQLARSAIDQKTNLSELQARLDQPSII